MAITLAMNASAIFNISWWLVVSRCFFAFCLVFCFICSTTKGAFSELRDVSF